MWDYLKKVYHQDNSTRQFHLECEIGSYTQGNLSIQDYIQDFSIYGLNMMVLNMPILPMLIFLKFKNDKPLVSANNFL